MKKVIGACVGAAASALASAFAQESGSSEIVLAAIDEITVFGSAGGLVEVPGAITYISAEDIRKQSYTDIQRTLRRAPGVNIQEEDGYGLRPNIGIRGSGSDRSARIVLMEDGVPIAPAPYAAPEAYYFPYAGRINAIEVTKGPAVIKYGPRTTGGAINLFSTPIPDDWSAHAQFLAGGDDSRRLHAWAGGRGDIGPFEAGVLIETFQNRTDGFKELDNGGDAGFDVSDYVIKAGVFSKDGAAIEQSLVFKYQRSDERSNETYVGLTRGDFALTPRRRYNGSQNDQFNSDHETFQLSYTAAFSPSVDFNITAYRTEFARDWFKLERVLGVSAGDILEDPATFAAEFENLLALPGFVGPDDALELRHNARDYYANGVQGTLGYKFKTGEIDHYLEASVRWHEDEVDRFQNFENFRAENGALFLTSIEAPGSDSNRIETGKALAYFIQDNIDWGDLHATIGVRIEDVDLERNDFGRSDPLRTGADLAVRENSVTGVSPAFGVVYDLTEEFSVLGGVYRGFSPPSPGASNSNEEESTNWEAGFRWTNGAAMFEAIGYFNDYSNLLGSCTASSGGGCVIGEQFDGGEVDVYGVEVVASVDLADAFGARFAMPLAAAYTLTQTEFKTSFASDYDPWGDVVAGDELPYVADHHLFVTLGAESERIGGEIAMLYQSERRTVAGQGAILANDRLDPHVIFDFTGYLQIVDGVRIIGKIENMFNEVYIASDQPAGLRPGLPRTFWAGVDLTF